MDLEVENVAVDSFARLGGFIHFPLPVISLYAWNNTERLGIFKKLKKTPTTLKCSIQINRWLFNLW